MLAVHSGWRRSSQEVFFGVDYHAAEPVNDRGEVIRVVGALRALLERLFRLALALLDQVLRDLARLEQLRGVVIARVIPARDVGRPLGMAAIEPGGLLRR